MIKRLLTPLIFTSLYAEESETAQALDPEVVQSLYVESALFVAVFTAMSIISIVISKKHAAQNLENDRKKREAKAKAERAQEDVEKRSQPVISKETEERVTELSEMLKNGLISEEEFKILSNASKVS